MQQPRTSVRFTLRGRVVAWLAALAAGAAWAGGDANARLAASLLAAPLLVDFLLKPRRLHLLSVRAGRRRTIAGALFVERLTIEHPGRLPLSDCLLVEPWTMRDDARALLPRLPSGKPVRIEVHARSKHRGREFNRVFVLESAWPLGLLRARAAVTAAAELVTEPARIALPAEITRRIADRHSAHDVAHVPFGAEFHSLREQGVFEDARGVHARRSAATGTLVRRIDHGSAPERIGIVLDLRRQPGTRHRRSPRFEWAMSACATLVAELRRRGSPVQVFVCGDGIQVRAIESATASHDLMTVLAEAVSVAHRPWPPERLDALRHLEHCFWIAAGARGTPPEVAQLGGNVTVVEDPRP